MVYFKVGSRGAVINIRRYSVIAEKKKKRQKLQYIGFLKCFFLYYYRVLILEGHGQRQVLFPVYLLNRVRPSALNGFY